MSKLHNEEYEIFTRKLKDQLHHKKLHEAVYLLGAHNFLPAANPQGSFNRMGNHSANHSHSIVSQRVRGGIVNTPELQNWLNSQQKQKARELDRNEVAQLDGIPAREAPNDSVPDDVETQFELFFNDLTNSDFALTNHFITMKESKKILSTLKEHGLGLSLKTLQRYERITESHLDTFISLTEQLFPKNEAFTQDADKKKDAAFAYVKYVENVDYYDVIFKIYLVLKVLINNFDKSPAERRQDLNAQFSQIIKAPVKSIIPESFKVINQEVKNGVKNVRDVLTKDAYQAIQNYMKRVESGEAATDTLPFRATQNQERQAATTKANAEQYLQERLPPLQELLLKAETEREKQLASRGATNTIVRYNKYTEQLEEYNKLRRGEIRRDTPIHEIFEAARNRNPKTIISTRMNQQDTARVQLNKKTQNVIDAYQKVLELLSKPSLKVLDLSSDMQQTEDMISRLEQQLYPKFQLATDIGDRDSGSDTESASERELDTDSDEAGIREQQIGEGMRLKLGKITGGYARMLKKYK